MATLYYNAAVNENWQTLGNWWQNSNFTVPATNLPTSTDDVIIAYNISSNSGSEPTVANLTINGSWYIDIAITVSNNCTFNDSSVLLGVINGNTTFNNNSLSVGTVNGSVTYNGFTGWSNESPYFFNKYFIGGQQTSLDSSGNGSWNNGYYLGGVLTTLDVNGNGSWNGVYYIAGTSTSLNESGTGSWNGSYYITGTQTTLNQYGNGTWDGIAYVDGNQNSNSWSSNENVWYINGTSTTLDSFGAGCWNSVPYSGNGLTIAEANYTGYDFYCNIGYYINGQYTDLDFNGSGCWNGVNYHFGSPGVDQTFSGYSSCDSTYYVLGQATTLNSEGTGTWNGVEYVNGVGARTLYYNAAVNTDWDTLGNWWNDLACTQQATGVPLSIDTVIILSGASVLSYSSFITPTVKNLTVQ